MPRVIFIQEFVRFPPAARIVSLKDLSAASGGVGGRRIDARGVRRRTPACTSPHAGALHRFMNLAAWASLQVVASRRRLARHSFPQPSFSTDPLR
ncbi:hypothetical protein [Burkholderia cepacia]|uniref:hypothetical protein n=1 Tax=Burkholderia cepacia TaxID=292 RepID=UPI0012D8DA65|nr:hypothetical protein [Burkholderia cepacia]